MEQEHQQEAVAEPAPAQADSASASRVPATALKGASNAALAAWLSRAPAAGNVVARTVSDADKTAMQEVETKMDAAKTAASARSTQLNTMSDQSTKALQDAHGHLQKSLNNYSAGYATFKGVMDRAQEAFETEQAILDAVQGILIAAALAAIGPELLLVKGGMALVEAAAAKAATNLAAGAFKAAAGGAVGEVAEMGAGAAASGARESTAPSSTVAGAGATPSEKYQEAFGKLGELIQAMPRLGKASTVSKDIMEAAGDVKTEAARLGSGGTGKWSISEVQSKSGNVEAAEREAAPSLEKAKQAVDKVKALSAKIVAETPIKSPPEVEMMIWHNWIANLGSNNEILDDNTVLQEYLEEKGLLNPDGGYLTDLEQGDAVIGARKEVLKSRGIDPESGDVDTLYRREMKLDEIKKFAVGKKGRTTSPGKVSVEGRQFDFPHGGWPQGTEVDIVGVAPKNSNPGGIIAHFHDHDFYVHAIPVSATANPVP